MASARFAWGIDIGNRALKAVRLVRGAEGLQIDDFEVVEHENVLSHAGDNKDALIQSALHSFIERHQTRGGVVAVGVSGVTSFARFIKLPPVEKKKIPEIVKFEAIQQIPFPLDDVEWSYQLFQEPESPEVEVGIFAMRKELVNRQLSFFIEQDMNIQVVQTNPLAVYNAMSYDGRLKGTTMIIDMGAENTDLIIADGETIWMRSIPIGGNNFTDVLIKSFKLPFGKAEDLKRNANTSKYARQIFQAMRPIFADLVAEIQRSIGFYSSVHKESRIKKIIAVGGTFRLAGLQKYLQQNLQLDVEKVSELAAGAPADANLAATFNQNVMSLVNAYGLAIQAMGDAKVNSSLLPMRIRREKMWRDKTKWFAATAATFVAGSALAVSGYFLQDLQYSHAQEQRSHIDNLITTAKADAATWLSSVETAGQSDRNQISNLRGMIGGRALWTRVLGDIFSAFPPVTAIARPTIVLDSMTSEYKADLTAFNTANPITAVLSTQAVQTEIPAGSRGFFVTLNVTTSKNSKQANTYLSDNLVGPLRKMNSKWMADFNQKNKDKKDYYFTRVNWPMNLVVVGTDANRKAQMSASYNAVLALNAPAGGAAPPAPVTPPAPPAPGSAAGTAAQPAVIDPAFLDRTTGESRLDDNEAKITFVVVIDQH
jgi:type IV pilus assembly protein PilM